MSARCSCHGAHFHCEGTNGLDTIRSIEQIGGAKVTGFSGKYSAAALEVPMQPVDNAFIQSLEQEKKDNEALRKQCNQKNNPDFEQILNP